ncbi:MAG TPA: biotin--[acetyl-CoA-carboxylase] ligase, partial [Chloroflexota bacterium]|nr:biotin--[acetyl-CoA-carboxylase] ligase [Chloroflexota bacterium]
SVSRTSAVVVGLGLNVNWGKRQPPEGGVALDRLVGHEIDRSTLLDAFLRRLDSWLAEPQPQLLASYRTRCCTLGRRVRVELGDGVVEGTARGITDTGHLVVESLKGDVEVASGDVVHVKSLDAGQAQA